MGRLDARVEQGDRHAAAVVAGQVDVRPGADPRSEPALFDQVRRRRGRVRDPDRVDAGHLRRPFEDRDRARVERRREAGEHARVAMLGLDLHSLLRQARDEQVVRRERRRRPAPLLSLGRLAAGRGDLVGERRAVQDDDDALTDRDLLARRADQAPPGRGVELRVLVARASRAGRHREQRRGERERAEHAQLRGLTPP